jgi:hypothetical protein
MTDFHRTWVNDRSFIRGAARILVAPAAYDKPGAISDVIQIASGSGQFDAVSPSASGWYDLGATKTGIQITINNAEETFDVDQILGDISSAPTNWECSVGTQLAEMTLERLQIAWEGGVIGTDDDGDEVMGVGNPTSYTERRLAVLFQRPSGLIRGYFFHRVQRMPQESSVTHAKTGEQISIPVRFRVLADSTESETRARFFKIHDQAAGDADGH